MALFISAYAVIEPADTASPCLKICQLDAGQQVCTGCGRSLGEIAEWSVASEPRRREIVRAAQARMAMIAKPGTAPSA